MLRDTGDDLSFFISEIDLKFKEFISTFDLFRFEDFRRFKCRLEKLVNGYDVCFIFLFFLSFFRTLAFLCLFSRKMWARKKDNMAFAYADKPDKGKVRASFSLLKTVRMYGTC